MYLSRVQIIFSFYLDVELDANVVMVGENRVGKSNFIFALDLFWILHCLTRQDRSLRISGTDATWLPQRYR